MPNKTFILPEGLTAFIQLIGLLLSMEPLMVDKVSIGTESFPTLIPGIRFLTCKVPDDAKGFYSERRLPILITFRRLSYIRGCLMINE